MLTTSINIVFAHYVDNGDINAEEDDSEGVQNRKSLLIDDIRENKMMLFSNNDSNDNEEHAVIQHT